MIVSYNSKIFLEDCLSSIFASTVDNLVVYLVDNNSSDGSVNFAKKNYPAVRVIESKENLGFAGGNNLGIREALKHKPEHIFLLNPDTIIAKDCLAKLLEKADQKTVMQPLILIHDGTSKTDLINTTGNHLNFLGISYCDDYKKTSTVAQEKEITTASGAAVWFPASILRKIGLFDESFFLYHEDLDLCWRARLYGYNIKLIPDAKIWHKYSFSRNKNKFFYIERNRLLFLYKNFSWKYLILIFPAFLINEIAMILYSLPSGWFPLKMKSYYSAIQLLGKESKERKNNFSNHIKTETNLKNFINAEISFSEVKNPLFHPYNVILKLYWAAIFLFV